MKKIIMLITLLFALAYAVPQASAITRHVNVSELEGELTQALRYQVSGLNYNDTVLNQYSCTTNNVLVSHNRFHNSDLTTRTVYVGLNPNDSFSNIQFTVLHLIGLQVVSN